MKIKKYPSNNIAFVMNIKQLVDGDFYHLAEDHVLRKATSDEIELIDKKILRLHGSNPDDKMNFWKKSSDSNGAIIHLPVEKWRYYVIEFTKGNQTLNELDSIFNITPTELEVGPAILSNGFIMIWSAELLFRLTTEAPLTGDNFFVDVATPDIDIINDLHRRFKGLYKGLIDTAIH